MTMPLVQVDVIERGGNPRKGRVGCVIDANLEIDSKSLSSYFFAEYNPVVVDALLVAAAIEFCDRLVHRPVRTWGRNFELRIPVHNPMLWGSNSVSPILHDLLEYLTGDKWTISFIVLKRKFEEVQGQLPLQTEVSAVIPYSNGLDSHVVSWMKGQELGQKLVRIHLRSAKGDNGPKSSVPFASIPFSVNRLDMRFVESSARSRGFKFSMISGMAAYLAKATRVIVSESGSGALGPNLVVVGQAYEDYRSYPVFTGKVSRLIKALFDAQVVFEFPQIWKTKGETLSEFIEKSGGNNSWSKTKSCWQDNRFVSVGGKSRPCGICAACMLRRLSVHAAGLQENSDTYVWESLRTKSFEDGASRIFKQKDITRAMREYGIAGALHLKHLADLKDSTLAKPMLNLRAAQLAKELGISKEDAVINLNRLLSQHRNEWDSFLSELGQESFVAQWAGQKSHVGS